MKIKYSTIFAYLLVLTLYACSSDDSPTNAPTVTLPEDETNDSSETPSTNLTINDPGVTEIPHGEADDGNWYMGSNKDGNAISYTSPCSPSAGTHEYTITVYALSATPAGLPQANSLDVTYDVLLAAIETVTVLGKAELTFDDVTE